MKKLLLILGLLPIVATAQKSEFGIAGGITYHTGASGSIYYKANEGSTSPVLNLTLLTNLVTHTESKVTTQLGINMHVLKLANESTDTFMYFHNVIGNDGKKFVYAQTAVAIAPMFNIKYKLSDRAYMYGGVSLGLVAGKTNSNKHSNDFEGTEKSYTAPNGGIGFCGGLQGGFVQRVTQRIAISGEVGVRYYNLNYSVDDVKYPGGTKFAYNTIAIPVTVGIRYRMGWEKQYNSAGKYRPIPEDLEKR